MAGTRKKDKDITAEPFELPTREDGKVQVWDMDNDRPLWVTPPEAASGMAAWAAREFGPGTAAHAAAIQRVVAFLAAHGYTPAGKPLAGGPSNG